MSRSSERWGVPGRGALAFPSPRSRGQRACRTGEHAASMSMSIPLQCLLATEETNRVADVLERPLEEARWA